MRLPRPSVATFCVVLGILGAGAASGQSFPTKPIRIVTAEPGGGGDVVARIVGQGLTARLGQQVIVDNRGGNAVIPAGIVAKANPDGYTVLLAGNTHWIYPLMQKVPYDPVKDYSVIIITTGSPAVLGVSPAVPAASVKDFIELAKARPGTLNYASGVDGSTTHLASELFKAMAGIKVVRISYKGANSAMLALAAGEVQMMLFPMSTGAPFMKSGRVKALAVASAQPSELAPGLPTVAASGLPGYEAGTLHAIFAPARTPTAVINVLNREIVQFLNTPATKEKFFGAGLEIVGSSPEQSAAIIKSEMSRLGKVIKDAGIQAQ